MKRIAITLLILGAVVFGALYYINRSGPTNVQETELSVRFPIPVVENGQSAFYAAEEAGAYRAEGLSVKFEMGSPELNPVAMVQSGQDDFGVLGGPDTLLVANSKGADLVAVAVLHRNSNFPVVLTLKDSGITEPSQLAGKKVGFFYGHISTDVIRNLFRNQKVEVEEVDSGFDYAPLINGNVSGEWAFRVTAGLSLPKQGVEINTIDPAKYGINSHGYTIFVRREFLEKNPDTINKFLIATFKGQELVWSSPKLGAKTITDRNPNESEELALERQKLYNEVTTGSEAPYFAGYMDKKMFQETYDRLLQEKVVEPGLDLDNQFDSSFVEKQNFFFSQK